MFETTNQDTSTGLPNGSILSPVPPGTSAPGISFSCCESPRSMAFTPGHEMVSMWMKYDEMMKPKKKISSTFQSFEWKVSVTNLTIFHLVTDVIFYRETSGKTMEKTHGISAAWMPRFFEQTIASCNLETSAISSDLPAKGRSEVQQFSATEKMGGSI